MARLMIVDDEPIMRKAVRAIVERHVPEICEVYDAESGRRAIELAGQVHPDIVCMDIKMPGVDGIEATRALRAICPEAIIFIISAFDEFKAATTFMKYGIRAYLLKPLDKNEFVKEIYAALEELDRRRSRHAQEMDMHEHLAELRGVLESEVAYTFILGDGERLDRLRSVGGARADAIGGVAIVVRFFNLNSDRYQGSVAYQRLCELLREYARRVGGIVSNIFQNRIVCFLYNERGEDAGRWLEDRVRGVRELVEVNPPITASIGIGAYVETLSQMRRSYSIASRAARNRPGDRRTVFYGEGTEEERGEYPIAIEREVLACLEREDAGGAIERFDAFFEAIDAEGERLFRRLSMFALSVAHFRFDKKLDARIDGWLEEMDDAVLLYKWCRCELGRTVEDLRGLKESLSNNLIEDAIQFIHENYMRPIALDDIARSINISSFYFTKLFKARTGKTFVEYLTDHRMEVAKRLLRENLGLKIHEIGERVGYVDHKYFCKRFRSNVGISPAGYRDRPE